MTISTQVATSATESGVPRRLKNQGAIVDIVRILGA